jgi:hypothetical protein
VRIRWGAPQRGPEIVALKCQLFAVAVLPGLETDLRFVNLPAISYSS